VCLYFRAKTQLYGLTHGRRRGGRGGANSTAAHSQRLSDGFFSPRYTIPPPNNTTITSRVDPCVGIHRVGSSSSSTMVMVRTLTKSNCTISGTRARTRPTYNFYTDRETHYTGCC